MNDITKRNRTAWDTLLREFTSNRDYGEVRPWLREVKGWSEARLDSGNTKAKTSGWIAERRMVQAELFEQAMWAAKESEKELIVDLLRTKRRLLERLMLRADTDTATTVEVISVLKTLKTELGEPNSIAVGSSSVGDTELIDEGIRELRAVVRQGS